MKNAQRPRARTVGDFHGTSDESPVDATAASSGRVLVVDDESGTREVFCIGLRSAGFDAIGAASVEEAMRLLGREPLGLLVVDLRLPDASGLTIVQQLQREHTRPPFVVVSGFLTIRLAVQAMRLGALDILEKPVDIDSLVAIAKGITTSTPERRSPEPALGRKQPGSVAERWAQYVWQGCACEHDPRTLDDWSSSVGVSASSLGEICRLLHVRPHDARDLVRALRAVRLSQREQCPVAPLLDVSDRRTLRNLLHRAGLVDGDVPGPSVETFLKGQSFVPADHSGLVALLRILERDRRV